ncbi:hypothetical protein F4778DRAFT_777262 [Xylariomycetidae sp. FL2044]|nr:hypothetical protein F4778DRAFT_777262 [Xylariomycetidae sp. FL2044]
MAAKSGQAIVGADLCPNLLGRNTHPESWHRTPPASDAVGQRQSWSPFSRDSLRAEGLADSTVLAVLDDHKKESGILRARKLGSRAAPASRPEQGAPHVAIPRELRADAVDYEALDRTVVGARRTTVVTNRIHERRCREYGRWMDLVYSLAHFTIVAAAAGPDSSYGLPGVLRRRNARSPVSIGGMGWVVFHLPPFHRRDLGLHEVECSRVDLPGGPVIPKTPVLHRESRHLPVPLYGVLRIAARALTSRTEAAPPFTRMNIWAGALEDSLSRAEADNEDNWQWIQGVIRQYSARQLSFQVDGLDAHRRRPSPLPQERGLTTWGSWPGSPSTALGVPVGAVCLSDGIAWIRYPESRGFPAGSWAASGGPIRLASNLGADQLPETLSLRVVDDDDANLEVPLGELEAALRSCTVVLV